MFIYSSNKYTNFSSFITIFTWKWLILQTVLSPALRFDIPYQAKKTNDLFLQLWCYSLSSKVGDSSDIWFLMNEQIPTFSEHFSGKRLCRSSGRCRCHTAYDWSFSYLEGCQLPEISHQNGDSGALQWLWDENPFSDHRVVLAAPFVVPWRQSTLSLVTNSTEELWLTKQLKENFIRSLLVLMYLNTLFINKCKQLIIALILLFYSIVLLFEVGSLSWLLFTEAVAMNLQLVSWSILMHAGWVKI